MMTRSNAYTSSSFKWNIKTFIFNYIFMNKNKIIFLILGVILVVVFVSLFLLLSKTGETKKTTSNWEFTLWILQDDRNNFSNFLNDFKAKNANYKNTTFNVVSFQSYEEYYNALIWVFLRNEAPDMFVVNNNDSQVFEWQISGIDPSVISPDEFKKNYDLVFSSDLIKKTKVDDKDVDYLIGMPLWYENLWIFYNFRETKGKKLSTWAYINEVVRELRDNSGKIWIWIGNGSTVYNVWDIITQFFLIDGIKNLSEATGNAMKWTLSNYVRFWDEMQENKYDSLYNELLSTNKNNLDAFSKWDVQMILWYPRLLEEISKRGFNKNFLRAEAFPMNNEDSGNLLINYNYFVINKNTSFYQTAQDLMVYFNSVEGQKKYLELFAYYMPSQLWLVTSRWEENLKDGFNIKYKDFYNGNLELTTFNKWNKTIYDSELSNLLDAKTNSTELFEIFRKKVLCISEKTLSSENLEKSCN